MLSSNRAAAARRGSAVLLFLALSINIIPAASPKAVSPNVDKAASRFLQQKLQTWQQRLALKDWDIQINLVRASALEPKTLGNIKWDTDLKQATISVLSSKDYKLPYQPMLNDMEFTVVHELVHLTLSSLPRSEASRRTEEHAVNELSAALLKLAKR